MHSGFPHFHLPYFAGESSGQNVTSHSLHSRSILWVVQCSGAVQIYRIRANIMRVWSQRFRFTWRWPKMAYNYVHRLFSASARHSWCAVVVMFLKSGPRVVCATLQNRRFTLCSFTKLPTAMIGNPRSIVCATPTRMRRQEPCCECVMHFWIYRQYFFRERALAASTKQMKAEAHFQRRLAEVRHRKFRQSPVPPFRPMIEKTPFCR